MQVFLRRIGFYLVAAVAAVSLDFLIPRLVPGNPVLTALAQMKSAPPQAIKALELQVRGRYRTEPLGAVPALLEHDLPR